MTRRSWAFDIAIALVVAAMGLAEALWGINATHRQGPVAAEAAVYVVTGLLLVLRRVRPLGCLAAIVAVSAVEYALVGSPEGQGVLTPGVVATYSIGRYVDRRRSWRGLVLVALLWLAWDGFDPMDATVMQHVRGLPWAAPWIIAWLVGALVRSQAQNSEQRRAARRQRESHAVVEERNRIARELHDVIGHSVSVMTVQASAVRRRLTPDQHVERQALETVEAVGREALSEMRRMVGVLRDADDSADRRPPPGLDQVERLVAKFGEAGLPVTLIVSGTSRSLTPGLDLTAYRLLQEGLTNALRHADAPREVRVGIAYTDSGIELSVRDDGRPVPAAAETGHGLLGMRERVAVYGGTLSAGPLGGGGFELVARLPLDEGASRTEVVS